MVLLLILALSSDSFSVEKNISVDSGGHIFEYPKQSEVQGDGSIIVVNDHQVFHFSQNGSLIRKLGAKGNGPGEFVMAYEAFWNGTSYLVQDNRRRDLSFFSSSGEFIKREPKVARHFYFLGNRTLMVDSAMVFKEQPAICPVDLSHEFTIESAGAPFHAVIPEIKQLGYNFSNIFVTLHEGHIYVMDELSAQITCYSTDFQKRSTIAGQLQGFIEPPTSWPTGLSTKVRRQLIFTFSRIQRLGSVSAGLVVGYYSPHPDDLDDRIKNIAIIDLNGKPIWKTPLRISGDFIGTYKDRIYVLKETDDLRYEINVIQFNGS